MNDQELLAELAELQPRAISPELPRRIADELGREPAAAVKSRRRVAPRLLAAASLAATVLASSLILAILAPRYDRTLPGGSAQATDAPLPIGNIGDERLPSVWAYRQAIQRGDQAFADLLEKHSFHQPVRTPAEWHVFTLSVPSTPRGEL